MLLISSKMLNIYTYIYIFTKISYLAVRYLFLMTTALLNFFMVMFKPWQHLVKVKGRSWSGLMLKNHVYYHVMETTMLSYLNQGFCWLNVTTDRTQDANPTLWCHSPALCMPAIHLDHAPATSMRMINVVIHSKKRCL